MADPADSKDLKRYPIQLRMVTIKELFFEAFRPLSPDFELGADKIKIASSFAAPDQDDAELQIGIGFSFCDEEPAGQEGVDPEDDSRELKMRVRIVGHFAVDKAKFPMDRLEEWSRYNAPMILYPFLREQVYSLTARCAVRPLILPLVYLPTMNIAPSERGEASGEQVSKIKGRPKARRGPVHPASSAP